MQNEEAQQPGTPAPEQSAETLERSATATIIQGISAAGSLAGGIAGVKVAFGGGGGKSDGSETPPAPASESLAPQQAQPTSTDDG